MTAFSTPRLAIAAFLAVTLVPSITFARVAATEPKPISDAEAHRPSAVPDRIILTFGTADPAHSLAVTWRTDASVAKAVAQIAPAEAAPLFAKAAKTIAATTQPLTSDLNTAHYHSAVFEGLTPASQYAYRVGDGANWSAWQHVRTASDKPEPFTFLYLGDAQNDIKSLWSRVAREAILEAPRARFILHAGDLVNDGYSDAQWGEWHSGPGWVNGAIPSIPSPGNHEYHGAKVAKDATVAQKAAAKFLTQHWRAQFANPLNGPAGLEEAAYFVDYQGVRIVSLNSNEKHAEQAAWMRNVLKDHGQKWIVVTFHHPVYSAAKERDNADLRRLWQPVFDEFKVDLVLQGHDHTYYRGGLISGESTNVPSGTRAADLGTGTVYVVSVAGPKMYKLDRKEWIHRAAEDTQLFQVITVDGDSLHYAARTATNDLYDAFDLVKRPGQANALIEHVPGTPERLRPTEIKAAEAGAGR